ncbi:DNA cytosine methyltransferase [Segniliparus rugosus]|uniref:DNA (cytosine-5-)-methyltransferase n=1 Tax=Segniliparus rugosus (strain ATCC BAA-974 / DSM 45345 / CCUG 50838 / CIP 108380 / JCM 13579 / CDC 945) TaxID=679197 RepID=E5XLQ9_SEGRC|nr:DNA cytosine methyltransferase [Segniliparus rugosus]EFV14737.1 hypothetical protein HMPREF9336_00428 [Segniliparus rugosus ATCC BAA-974]
MILDLFSGVGGWLEGLGPGVPHVGVEIDPDAAATSRAAGHNVVQADVTLLDPSDYSGIVGITASPPCQSFSVAGSGAGRAALDRVLSAVRGNTPALDRRTRLTVEPLRWIKILKPEWVCMEQVPTVLPVWRAYSDRLRQLGYAVDVGVLDASYFGVPQSRKRAVLIASRLGKVELPWPGEVTPMSVVFAHSDGRVQRSNYSGSGPVGARTAQERGRTMRGLDQPSVTITRRAPQWEFGDGDRRTFTVSECAALQSFRPDFPWSGGVNSARLQCGNAVPPLLARALIAAATKPVGRVDPAPFARVGILVPRGLSKRLRLAATSLGVSASDLAREAVENAVKSHAVTNN